MTTEPQIQLGQKVRDTITGLEGIAIGITEWMFGCRRIIIQPQELKDGKPVEAYTADEPACVLLAERQAPPAPTPRRAGPREDAVRADGNSRR